MTFYQIIQGLGELSDEELRRLTSAIHHETGFRERRRELDQLNLTEQQEGQADFENELIKGKRK